MFLYLAGGAGVLFGIILIAYFALRKKLESSTARQIQKLREGTKEKSFSTEILYQKLYIIYKKIPLLKRYVLKIRRRLEIINIDDEYLTRRQASVILTRAILIIIPLTLLIILLTKDNVLIMFFLIAFELFMIDTIIDGMVDKIDNKLLKEQINFFSEIRHAYHEFNMVEEAIYQVSQDDDQPEMSRQAEKIYEILISDEPESGLEQYYDVAPNSYLKEFAGVSYLTKEFGDRTIDGSSLYLKNLNNITQEMQLEILKRDKLDYVFQSLSFIAIAPILALEPIKNWALSQFSFTASFYSGKVGMIVQILILILTIVCYVLIRKLKDNGSVNMDTKDRENPWQAKLYKNKLVKKFVNLFIPKQKTKEYRKLKQDLKDAASKDKIEWFYINRILLCIIVFIVSMVVMARLHKIVIDSVYTDPVTDFSVVGTISEKDIKKGMEITESDNEYIEYFKGKSNLELSNIEKAMKRGTINKDYIDSTDEQITTAAKRVKGKIETVNSEKMQWFEILISMIFAVIGYNAPRWMLTFQAKMRQLEMEDEVMQFHTIILMLMKIERVNVEIILEWLERYANIFKEPISRCVNDYESGPWEALEKLKEEVSHPQFIRIVESLQASVEKIPIAEAFDELDTERDYYQARRKESNERLISRKGMIGKVVGFGPMVILFVGYLIIPLVFVGLSSMGSTFNQLQ